MKVFMFLILISTFINTSYSQKLHVTIIDEHKNIIPNSTLYVKEIATGTVADNNGKLQIELATGNYSCEFRSLGFQSLLLPITMGNEDKSMTIELKEAVITLNEVVISAENNEDPAYKIIRKAIIYKELYKNQIESYNSMAYIKGRFKINKIPFFLKGAITINGKKSDSKMALTQTFVLESNNEIEYKEPSTYNQKVLAIKSTVPKELDLGGSLDILTSSIYDVNIFDKNAFGNYYFQLIDIEYDNDRVINKIKITPKRKNPELIEGDIYILDNTWNVYAANFKSSSMGITSIYKINFNEVKPTIYLPTTYDMNVNIKTFGIEAEGKYFVSLSYKSVNAKQIKIDNKVNLTSIISSNYNIVKHNDTKHIDTQLVNNKKDDKLLNKINKLSAKEKLTTRESFKLAKLINKSIKAKQHSKSENTLELKEYDLVKMNFDSLAYKKDSNYWNKVRALPLLDDEIKAYNYADSLMPHDSLKTYHDGKLALNKKKSALSYILYGTTIKLNNKSNFNISGLASLFRGYSFVSGLMLGQEYNYNLSINNSNSFKVKSSIWYSTARKYINHITKLNLNYAPMHLGELCFTFGHTPTDVKQNNEGYNMLLNSFSSVVFGKSYIQFYDKKFAMLTNNIDIINGLALNLETNYEAVSPLNNLINYNLKKIALKPNILNELNNALNFHKKLNFTIGITYTPEYKYRIIKGMKHYVKSKYPTFNLKLTNSNILNSNSLKHNYNFLSLNINQKIETSLFSKFIYSIEFGLIDNKNILSLTDYKYFAVNPTIVNTNDFNNSFNLVDNYIYSKQNWYKAHFTYNSYYLLIKNLPFLQQYLFDESIHVSILGADNIFKGIETGYSIGFYNAGRAGVFTLFNNKSFTNIGFRISILLR